MSRFRPARGLAALLLLAACASVPSTRDDASLVAAERAFARMSVEQGLRAAFLANLAPDAIGFAPGPVRLRDDFAAQPAPAEPHAITLDWAPAIAGVARSGDMGFTHGPFTLTDNKGGRPTRHGLFFSVWSRSRERAEWKVAIDAGVRTPSAVDPATIATIALPPAPADARDATLDALHAKERGPGRLSPAAYAAMLAPAVRLLREGSMPLLADAAIADAQLSTLALTPAGGAMAASGELAYSYGALTEQRPGEPARVGHYVHLWTRAPDGGWLEGILHVKPECL